MWTFHLSGTKVSIQIIEPTKFEIRDLKVCVHPSLSVKALVNSGSRTTSQKALEPIITAAPYDETQAQNIKTKHRSYCSRLTFVGCIN